MRTSELPQQIAQQISLDIAAGALKPGDHVRTQVLADRFGVSRSPVRIALELLAEQGFLEQRQHKGYFVASDPPSDAAGEPRQMFDEGRMSDYQRLADDWLTDRIPAEVTEQGAPARSPSTLRNRFFEAFRWLAYGSVMVLHRMRVFVRRP